MAPAPPWKKLFDAARRARLNSHSPYSGFKVGAAVWTEGGQVFPGTNVENANYGGGVCAERTAIFQAVAAGKRQVRAVMVVTDASPPWPPCGDCRQVIAEFAQRGAQVRCRNLKGEEKVFTWEQLLPEAFTPDFL